MSTEEETKKEETKAGEGAEEPHPEEENAAHFEPVVSRVFCVILRGFPLGGLVRVESVCVSLNSFFSASIRCNWKKLRLFLAKKKR